MDEPHGQNVVERVLQEWGDVGQIEGIDEGDDDAVDDKRKEGAPQEDAECGRGCGVVADLCVVFKRLLGAVA